MQPVQIACIKLILITDSVIKGVTHCLLPECKKTAWPFENYCGRTHADIGKRRGLLRM